MLSEQIGLSQAVLEPVLKIAGISVLTRVSAEICRDAKESGIAAGVETAGAALALVTALPLLEAVMSTLRQLL
jgi:stage III sporulation protein AD